MKTTRRTIANVVISAAWALLATAPLASFAQDIKPRLIRFGYGLNEQSNQGRAAKFFAEQVEKASGGKMKVRAIGAAALGPDVQMQQALIGGAQEMMVGSTATLVGITKEMALWDTPFLFNNAKEADTVLDGPIGQKVNARLQDKGLVGLAYWENGFRNLTNSKRPVTKLEDMHGLKIRVEQNAVAIDTWNALGTNAVPMPFPELYTALEQKAVDGQENPYSTVENSKFTEVQKYLSITKHKYTPLILIVSKKFWDPLSNDEKKILQDAATEAAVYQRKVNRELDEKYLQALKAAGMQISEIPAPELAKIRAKTQPVVDKYSKQVGEALVKDLYAEIDKVRKSK